MLESVEVMISEQEIQKRLDELAAEISQDYAGKTITLVCVLKGGVIFMADLARKIKLHVEFDFIDISSYGSSTVSSGIIRINKDLEHSITGKYVLLAEDIIDSGNTLGYLLDYLNSKQPAGLKVCSLLDKPDRRAASGVKVDYTGFVIPDEFVVGYGLDYDQKYRNLPYIGILKMKEGQDIE